MNNRILGIDPGLNLTGYGVIDVASGRPQLVEAGVVRSTARKSLDSRLLEIHNGMCDVISSLEPHCMALEELYSHYERPKTAIWMGHARGVICLAAAQSKIPVIHYAATQIKRMLTGSGRSPKLQMQRAIAHELGLSQPPDPPDVADALAVACCHFYFSKNTAEIS